jgi:soluble lytic murein transglycosylase-like protein
VLAPALALALLASAAGARADVLEIGPAGAVWVAGGPAALAPASATPPPASPAYTTVTTTAGPEAWRPHVAALAARYDISPALLEAVVWQESRWNAAAVSPAGARGLAQLMPATGRQLGVDWRDPRANLEGGARYLRMQLDRFGGDVEKALAAYNAGPERVARAGGVPNIRETRQYVAAIMARLAQPVTRP